MKKEELALILNGRQYRKEMTADEEKLAKENGLVVCFGASDDLVEFRGGLYDEKGVWEGGWVYFQNGEIANGDDIDLDDLDIKTLHAGTKIYAKWLPKKDGEIFASWAYETDIPHATFDIFEDGELYCQGIIFDYSFINSMKQDLGKESILLDCENQHITHYQEGYRESMLTQLHGENKVWDSLQIDVDRYSPGSAKRISYDQGWKDAITDYQIFEVRESIPLGDVTWLHLGTTGEYSLLKKRIAHICRDVTHAACIDELCMHDIVYTFRQFGYEVVKK